MLSVVARNSQARPVSPARTYLARLGSAESRRVQAQALRSIAQMLWPQESPVEALSRGDLWSTLTPEACVAVAARLAAGRAPATAARHLAALRGVIAEAWRLGYISAELRDRLRDLPRARGSRVARGRALTASEVRALIDAADARDSAMLGLLLGGGLRRTEAARLGVEDVRSAMADALETRGQRSLVVSTPLRGETRDKRPDPEGLRASAIDQVVEVRVVGKGDKERTCYIAGAWAHAINRWASGRSAGPLLGAGLRTGGGVWKALGRLRVRAGVAPFTPHDLRRTYASNALAAGIDLVTVQAAMGHADPRTTARYDRRGRDAQVEAAVRLTRALESSTVSER